jgi:hypothetical protein
LQLDERPRAILNLAKLFARWNRNILKLEGLSAKFSARSAMIQKQGLGWKILQNQGAGCNLHRINWIYDLFSNGKRL